MRKDPEILHEVRQWVAKAETDFRLAEGALKRNEDWEADDICFHAQQCVEKYLKSYLVLAGIQFTKTHSIKLLFKLLPADVRPRLSVNDRDMLTTYAVTTRYPGDYDPTTINEARVLVRMARRVRNRIRRGLPAGCLS